MESQTENQTEDQSTDQQVFLRVDISGSWVIPMSHYVGDVSEPSAVAAYEQQAWADGYYTIAEVLALANTDGRLVVRFSSEAVESERV